MIDWITKTVNYNRADSDVSIKVVNDRKRENIISIIFRNNVAKKISKTDYIVVGIDKPMNRVYFSESTDCLGYKVSRPNNKNNQVKLQNEQLARFEGNYDLQFNPKKGLYFIHLGE